MRDKHKIKTSDASRDSQQKIFVIFSGGNSSKNSGTDQQRLQISDLHFDKFPTPSHVCLLEDKIQDRGMYLFTISYGSYALVMEVEMVDPMDDLKSSSSIRGIQMPNFEVLDSRIASPLNKIIQNTQFKRKVSLEGMKAQKEDRFLCGKQIAYLIYEYFRVTGANDSVENSADLFTISLRNDDIQEFDSKWDGILLSLTKILP